MPSSGHATTNLPRSCVYLSFRSFLRRGGNSSPAALPWHRGSIHPCALSAPAFNKSRTTSTAPAPAASIKAVQPWWDCAWPHTHTKETAAQSCFSAQLVGRNRKDMCLERPPKFLLIGRWCYCYEATSQGHQADVFNLNPWIGRLCGRRI